MSPSLPLRREGLILASKTTTDTPTPPAPHIPPPTETPKVDPNQLHFDPDPSQFHFRDPSQFHFRRHSNQSG